MNLESEIKEAAIALKEEKSLSIEVEEISNILSNWIEDQLEEIEWFYNSNSSLQRAIEKAEVRGLELTA